MAGVRRTQAIAGASYREVLCVDVEPAWQREPAERGGRPVDIQSQQAAGAAAAARLQPRALTEQLEMAGVPSWRRSRVTSRPSHVAHVIR